MATLPISRLARGLVAATFVVGAVGCGSGSVEEEDVCRWVLIQAGPDSDTPDDYEDLASDIDSILEMTRAFESSTGADTFTEAAHNLEVGVQILRTEAPETGAAFIQLGLAGYASVCEPYWDRWAEMRG